MSKNAFFIVDIGTGNVRTALVDSDGSVLHVERDNVHYEKDDRYPEALHFNPVQLWRQIIHLARKTLKAAGEVNILAATASSQREGIVLLDAAGESLIGLPNHDHRGREWEDFVISKDRLYQLTGRFPTSLFSALKMKGVKERRPEIYEKTDAILSISDWAQYMLCGIKGYEHSQASETQLYDVEKMEWSDELIKIFDFEKKLLPKLHQSGTVLGKVLPNVASDIDIPQNVPVVVGGADTQLAIKSTQPVAGDMIVVSGTTTPVVKVLNTYRVDSLQRTWTGRHIEQGEFVLEANAGVTGLNYQRLKEIFYPNEEYEVIEQELENLPDNLCVASLGSTIASETRPLTRGGFVFDAPVSHQLTRAHFAQSILWDLACSIKENVDVLKELDNYEKDYVWGCGGGFRSHSLRQLIASLLGKRILIRENFQHASVIGGALVCMEAVGGKTEAVSAPREVTPQPDAAHQAYYQQWKQVRLDFKRNGSRE